MNKSIWIINEYAGSPYHGMEFRHYYISKELAKRGYSVTIITASFSHLFKKLPEVDHRYAFEQIDGINYLWLAVNNYGTSHDKRRVLKWLMFAGKLFNLPLDKMDKPDLILVSPMATFPILPAYRLAKKFGCKLAFEIKDIWPLSLVEIGGYSKNNLFIRILRWFEHFGLKNSDYIISNLPNYGQHILDEGFNRDFIYIPNGVDIDELHDQKELDEKTLSNIPKNKFIIGYVGTIGVANALEYLVDAAKLLENEKLIHFVIVGDGQEKKSLVDRANGVANLTFVPSIEKKQVQSMLSYFDACYIGLRKEKLFEYGVSPNKLFDYMLSGKPVIHAIKTKKDLVAMAECGVSIEAENTQSIVEGVLNLFNMSKERRMQLGRNGKSYVLAHHVYGNLADKYEDLLR